jgi:parvulin-like peptidyl-prolyl isomerase
VTAFLKEELLAREARAMGLDENDSVIRRVLAQKVEFLVQNTSRLAEPAESDLRAFYAAHREQFQSESRIAFTQIFFSREKRNDAAADAKAALEDLRRSSNAVPRSGLGDASLIEADLRDLDPQAVASQFGREFAKAVFALEPGTWSGPIASGFGLHLVRVSELKRGRLREYDEVKAQVLNAWREQRQREDNEKYFKGLLKKYDVLVDESVKPLVGPLESL